ncbi:hypothetical protein FJZ36_01985 [Candidatus Poribacteria bacterium]|nr:hypothetical protein [Candidatus Poribacteria bacterium]
MPYVYRSVHPIGDTDPNGMPVADVERAAAWYAEKMGFRAKPRRSNPVPTVVLERDGVEFTIAENGGDPEQASLYLAVSDVEAASQDLASKGLRIANRRIDEHNGARYDVFFVKDEDGLCYCIGQRLGAA